MSTPEVLNLPGHSLAAQRMPGHWLLARLGKRVLRPGGLELTRKMIQCLAVTQSDNVVEFAPGLGATARLLLAANPASYAGIERDAEAAALARTQLPSNSSLTISVGSAESTGLATGAASVVVGEAMLTMNTARQKEAIVREAHRLLCPGGRYAVHELALVPDTVDSAIKTDIQHALSQAIHVGARPLTVAEWKTLLADAGFEVTESHLAPMHLLEPRRLVADEGLAGALRFARNVLTNAEARQRVLQMRRCFRRYREQLTAVTLVAHKN